MGEPVAVHTYEVRPRMDRRGFDLVSESLPFGKLWYRDSDAAISYASFYSRAHDIEVRVYDAAGAVARSLRFEAATAEPMGC